MKTLYLDASMGASGDMLTAALYELLDNKNKETFLNKINSLRLDKVKVEAMPSIKCGIAGTKIKVSIDGAEEESEDFSHTHNGHQHLEASPIHTHHHGISGQTLQNLEHHHRDFKTIENIIAALPLSQKVKENAKAIYTLIAQAESEVHNKNISQIHFHEIGNLDAIADIAGVCLLLEMLNIDKIIASPINTGGGFIKCAHGILPIPAPAAANILKGIPIYSSNIKGELCTPTGAALLKYFVSSFENMPCMRIEKIGYGFGKKDFEVLNALRAFLGETADNKNADETRDEIIKLECNIDDMSGEAISNAAQIVLEKGALDVWTSNIYMKKSRPGILFSCICQKDKADFYASLILKHTSTFGIRQSVCCRYKLDREIKKVKTKFGDIRIKTGKGWGAAKSKYEYEDIAEIAAEQDMSFEEVIKEIEKEKI